MSSFGSTTGSAGMSASSSSAVAQRRRPVGELARGLGDGDRFGETVLIGLDALLVNWEGDGEVALSSERFTCK